MVRQRLPFMQAWCLFHRTLRAFTISAYSQVERWKDARQAGGVLALPQTLVTKPQARPQLPSPSSLPSCEKQDNICTQCFNQLGGGSCIVVVFRPLLFLKKDFLTIIFRQRGRGGERDRNINMREKHQCAKETLIGCLLHAHNPGMQPDQQGIELATFWFAGWCSVH